MNMFCFSFLQMKCVLLVDVIIVNLSESCLPSDMHNPIGYYKLNSWLIDLSMSLCSGICRASSILQFQRKEIFGTITYSQAC